MSPDERLRLIRSIPADLDDAEVVTRHGNAMQGPNDPCWYVSIRGKAVPGFYTPEVAARLRAQILEVSDVKTEYAAIKAGLRPPSNRCPVCLVPSETGAVCAPCIEAYQLEYKAPVVDLTDDSDILNYHNRY
jgi:hypothetical protein